MKTKKMKIKNNNNLNQLQCSICRKSMQPMEVWVPYEKGFAHSTCVKKQKKGL